MEDNDSSHVSKKAKEWKDERGIKTISWPSRSCDLNIIGKAFIIITNVKEHIWSYFKKNLLSKIKFNNIKDLRENANGVFETLSPDLIKTLYLSLKRRFNKVIENHGGNIPY